MKTITDLPPVSVIVPVYNGEETIAECIESLLRQNYPADKTEIIIVNNNSTDRTQEIIERYDVVALSETIVGPSAARNAGLRRAKGEILLMTDADCQAEEDWIEQHVQIHRQLAEINPRNKAIGGGIDGINKNFWSVCDDFCSWHWYNSARPAGDTFFHPTANFSVSREVIDESNIFFDDDLQAGGDDVAFCKFLKDKGYDIYFYPRAVVRHVNRTSFKAYMSHSKSWTKSEFLLHKKGIRPGTRGGDFLFLLKVMYLFLRQLGALMLNSVICRKFNVVFYLPMIALNKLFYSFYFMKGELLYHRYLKSTGGGDSER